jgi:hypothetical protein
MYQNFINTLLVIIAALALAAELNYLTPVRTGDPNPCPSMLYSVDHRSAGAVTPGACDHFFGINL